jgi:hypothetical protein
MEPEAPGTGGVVMEHGDVRPEIAMVSRIRVEVRGESMKAAEEVAFAALDQARLAGVFEGFAPTGGEYSDHFFNRPEVTRKYGDPAEPWGELGLPYYGRLSFVFEPQSVWGGLAQSGYHVEREPDAVMHPNVTDNGFIVLERKIPVTRDNSWEGVTSILHAEETGEAIIDDIRTIRDVDDVVASLSRDGAAVTVAMDGWESVTRSGATLREAALAARKAVVEMLERGTMDNSSATTYEILDGIKRLAGVRTVSTGERRIDVAGEPEGWVHEVKVSFDDGRSPVDGRGKTDREAALDAYGKCGVEITHFDSRPRVV